MAISPLGGAIYANQNTPVVSHAHQLEQGKALLQNYVAGELEKEKDKEIQETRPAEEIGKIKPEEEHEKDKKDQEQENEDEVLKKLKKRDDEQRISASSSSSSLLDIKV